MLGRLIKYDFKALNRFLIVIHGMLLISALLGRILVTGRAEVLRDPSTLQVTLIILGFIAIVILMAAASIGSCICIAMHFYKNIYSDEGYLTHTLPVTRGQILASKTIVGTGWMVLDQILIVVSIGILLWVAPISEGFRSVKGEILNEMGIPADAGFIQILLFMCAVFVISGISSVVTIYVSIAIGQFFGGHRVLGAVVVYFCISTVMGLFSSVLIMVRAIGMNQGEISVYEYYQDVLIWTLIISAVSTVIFYIITHVLMKKKLNLS